MLHFNSTMPQEVLSHIGIIFNNIAQVKPKCFLCTSILNHERGKQNEAF